MFFIYVLNNIAINNIRYYKVVIVASEVDRDLIYYTFENPETCRNLIRIIEIIKIGEAFRILCQYCNKIQKFLHKQETPSSPTDQIKNFFKNVFNIRTYFVVNKFYEITLFYNNLNY
ncbi:hypothetical protein BpHYR1_003456 [Brachionus plicatilis]|uniref:Uncharacterized protein n=1 Tax=Brachionus plicatilis TaxID=10195 RepID=A0A3M7TBT3_BRAPC|nr:hypothetical protein BpHYR1_003456 [Brachionus plicatilis]